MNWEVIAYGSGDMLRMIFTAIASIFGNADYKAAMQTAGMLGFVTVLFKAAFDRNVFNNFRWLIGTIVLVMVALVPKTTVIVNDRITPANSAVVNNVPIGLAATASFFSFTGDWLARSFETVFSMPSEVKYTTNGLLFPHKLYEATRKMSFPDDRTNNNFSEFFSSCVVVDGIGHNRFTWREVMESTDLKDFFGTRVAVNAARFKYTDGAGSESILPCRSGFKNTLGPDMDNLYTNVIRYGVQGDLISRFGGVDNAAARMTANMQNTISFLTGVSASPQKYVIQQAIANATALGTFKMAEQTNATETSQYLISGAELHRLTTYQALGDISSEKLPLLRIIFEAIIYAIFPIVVLMAIVIPGKVPMAYITALVWINLWAPMYAILHFIMSYYSQVTMTELAALYGNGFSVLANSEMVKFNSDVVATTGYLATALPMLAWMLVSKSGAMAASLAGRVMQGYDQSVEKGANEVVSGEGQRLGTKWEQTGSGGIQNSSIMDSGSRQTNTADGNSLLSQTTSSLLVSPEVSETAVRSKQQTVESATKTQEQERAQLAESNSALLSNSGAVMQQLSKEQGVNKNFKEAETAQQQRSHAAMEQAMDNYQKMTGVTLTDQAKLAVYAGAEGPGVDVSLFGFKLVETSAGIRFDGSKSETGSDDYKMAQGFTSSKQYSDVISSIGAATREMATSFGLKENNGSVDQLNASLSEQQNAQREHSMAVSQERIARESLNATEELRVALSVDGGQTLVNALLASNDNNIGRVDALLRDAARGSEEAMKNIEFVLIDADQQYGLSNDPNFKEVQRALLGEGNAGVNSTYESGGAEVNSQGAEWRSEVDGKAQVTKRQVESATDVGMASQQQAMNDPGSVITQNGTVDRLQGLKTDVVQKGGGTVDRVEDANYWHSIMLPFAATVFEHDKRNEDEDVLRDHAQERARKRNGE